MKIASIAAVLACTSWPGSGLRAQAVGRGSVGGLDGLQGIASLESLSALESFKSLESFQSLESLESLQPLGALRSLGSLGTLESLEAIEPLHGFERLDQLDGFDDLTRLTVVGDATADGVARRSRSVAARLPAPWAQGDPGDSLYRAARSAMNTGNYLRAAEQFERLSERYPASAYAGDALYWAAFSRYRLGGTSNLQRALGFLDRQSRRYADARTRRDGDVLATRIRGELARLGNAEAAESVMVLAAAPPGPTAPAAPGAVSAPRAPSAPSAQVGTCAQGEDAELRLAALNALLQMDSDRAIPILKQVLERRDECSVELRRKAVFLLSQKRGEDVEDVLLGAAQNDPDREVRSQAVFWLSQVPTERAVTALDSILSRGQDREIQEKAIFALSQHKSPQAGDILRRFVMRSDVSDDLKSKAIFWIGQQHSSENLKYLEDLYPRLSSQDLKERVIFSLSQMRDPETVRWLLDLARNNREPMEMRKKALFWAGQNHDVGIGDLVRLYDTMDAREMREQLVFVYSQRREPEAVDQLMTIAEKDPDPDLRKKAIFWLGQSKDPRAAEFLLRLINR